MENCGGADWVGICWAGVSILVLIPVLSNPSGGL